MSVESSNKQCDVGFFSTFQDTPMSDLVFCSFSIRPFYIYLSPLFLCLLSTILFTRDCMFLYSVFCTIQVNEKFFELKKRHIGIVEKAQETSSDSDMHNTVCLCHCCTS